jgi:hypothetical protein
MVEKSLASKIFTDFTVSLGVGIGVLFIWVASLIGILVTGADALKAVNALLDTGLALASVMMIGGGVSIAEKERGVRIALVVMGAILLLVLLSAAGLKVY